MEHLVLFFFVWIAKSSNLLKSMCKCPSITWIWRFRYILSIASHHAFLHYVWMPKKLHLWKVDMVLHKNKAKWADKTITRHILVHGVIYLVKTYSDILHLAIDFTMMQQATKNSVPQFCPSIQYFTLKREKNAWWNKSSLNKKFQHVEKPKEYKIIAHHHVYYADG